MGAGLVLAALAVAAEKGLDHAPTRLLVRMAASAVDGDPKPWSRLTMTERCAALGKADDEAGRRAVDRAIKAITATGLATLTEGGNRGGAAKYNLGFSAESTTLSGVLSDENAPRSASERTTVSGRKDHGERGAKEKEEDGGAPPRHPHERNVRAVLARVRVERHWPPEVSDDEIVRTCYRAAPDGDPWRGWQRIDAETNREFPDNTRSAAALFRYRLQEAAGVTP